MQQLSFMDETFLKMENARTPSHVGMFLIYDPSTAPGGTLTFTGLLANIERRLHLARCFRQKLVDVPLGLDHPYWLEDPEFDLEFHVRHIALPKPGDWRQFCIQAARLQARPLDLSRPPWEITVIEGLDNVKGVPPGSFALVLKIHHAAIDGVTGVQIVTAIHDHSADPAPPAPPDEQWRSESYPSPVSLLARAALHGVTRPAQALGIAGRLLPGRQGIGGFRRRREAPTIPRTRFNERLSAHRVVYSVQLPLSEMKRIKNAVPGTTINDVAMAVVSGALRLYLSAKDELPDDSLVAMVPISTRSADQAGTGGNQISGMPARLFTDVADPLARLMAVAAETRTSKEVAAGVRAKTLLEVANLMPGALIGAGLRVGSLLPNAPVVANTVVTNTLGPSAPLYFCGARMVTSAGAGPLTDGIGLMHLVTSYVDQFIVNVCADREMLPDPAFYAECLERSFSELAAAA